MKKLGSASDPLWYKDAVIYELHVRAFADSNNDGVGDFPGLMSKLDYLQDLGVTCLWLLPFFPSPLRDDGYDIANYVDVNPSYGTLNDFKQFLDAAHQRGMQVMIELVINHTSDRHPWFQTSRLAPPGSPEREMYVWSPTDQLYKDARIIFTDTEKSNWTWDETAQAYYWHRFFSHQPDLNFDNPRVMNEVISAMRFWLDMGVDALRLDAIPYLIERDGTSCENVPETHVKIKQIRAAMDAEYSGRVILAEANMWPADVRPYFGDNDECQMAFHFPLMPRIYMALRQEDRLPITEIMAQTPEIPPSCQWGLFLRNHDELTLEMVTNDERDYMYLAYSADPRMRINVGIRRRLAPLVDNNRRRIELLNSLLLSFPGTPILYYGDEIGMGDNIYLGDRNGVRTPMQWNSDRNAGFSRCDPARLYFPVVMDPIYGYQVVNVEAQLSDQSSLLHWTRNMIALRKLFQVFGRGTLEFLHPTNRKILAYLRKLKRNDGSDEVVLCVANLSRFAQPVSLELKEYAGMVPVEMLGYVSFPPIDQTPYALTIAPYSFLWFELQPAPIHAELQAEEAEVEKQSAVIALDVQADGWASLVSGPGLELLQTTIPAWLPRQRWFGAKSKTIASVSVLDWVRVPLASVPSILRPNGLEPLGAAIFFISVIYSEGESDTYQLPLAVSAGEEMESVLFASPTSVLGTLTTAGGAAILHDATALEGFRQALLAIMEKDATLPANQAEGTITLRGARSNAFASVRGMGPVVARTGSAEQSNTSILYGQKMILKLFRRLQPGTNPDIEIGRFLTDAAHFPQIATFLGDIQRQGVNGESTSVAMLQQMVANEGDGWQWTLEELARFYESVSTGPPPKDEGKPPTFLGQSRVSSEAEEKVGLYLAAAELLGQRTAEMHLALATETEEAAFFAEAMTADDLASDAGRIDLQIQKTFDALRVRLASFKNEEADDAATVLSRRVELYSRVDALKQGEASGKVIRIHGDYHLGQVLRSKNDFVLLDFEGEPARPLEERRRKQCPLKDVAGMLRSFSYAAWAGLDQHLQRRPETSRALEPWLRLWQNSVSARFLNAYRKTCEKRIDLLPKPENAQILLNAYLLEKSLYELLYELNNRPAWVRIPLAGILSLPQSLGLSKR